MKAKFNNGVIVDYPCNIKSITESRFYNWDFGELLIFVLENVQKVCLAPMDTQDIVESIKRNIEEPGYKEFLVAYAMSIDQTDFFMFVNAYSHGASLYKEGLFQLID